MRNYDGSFRRAYSISIDKGMTWDNIKVDNFLIDPVCEASILSIKEKGIVVFCNPASLKRENLTLKVSYDDCKNWSKSKVIYSGPSAYSDMAFLDNNILCVYENGETSAYEKISFTKVILE
jgi:sialidase-1